MKVCTVSFGKSHKEEHNCEANGVKIAAYIVTSIFNEERRHGVVKNYRGYGYIDRHECSHQFAVFEDNHRISLAKRATLGTFKEAGSSKKDQRKDICEAESSKDDSLIWIHNR